MLPSLDKDAAFAAIADDLELPLVLLSNPDPRVRLVQIEKIGAALAATNLTWRDLAERVVAPRPAAPAPAGGQPVPPPPPPPMQVPAWPDSEILIAKHVGDAAPTRPISPETVLTNHDLLRLGGYRTEPALFFGRYGNGPIPDECETIPGESLEDAGERIANWAIAKSGQPFWEDPATGRGYLPGVTVPGVGKVQPDGRLGSLAVEE